MNNKWIQVISCVHPAGGLSRGKNIDWTLHANFSTKFFHACHAMGTIDFYHFIPFSMTLALVGVTRSAQSKDCWPQFLTHFSADEDEICCEVEAI